MVGFLKNLIFPATDAGANETFLQPGVSSEKSQGDQEAPVDQNEHSPLLSHSVLSRDEDNKENQKGKTDSRRNGDECNGDHDHSHDHAAHGEQEGYQKDNHVLKRLKIATALCLTFMLIEVIGGILAGSLAVLSDAAHLMADLASFAVAIVAAHLAARPSTVNHTYGLKRVESLAALFSMSCLAVVSIGLALEAFRRIYVLVVITDNEVDEVDGKLMSIIAAIGVLVNVALAAVLGENHVHMPGGGHDHSHDHEHAHSHDHEHPDSRSEESGGIPQNTSSISEVSEPLHSDEVPMPHGQKEKNVNLQAAYLHVLADLTQSVAVLIAGLIIWARPTWQIVDPIATILFCILVFYSTLGVIRSAVAVLLEEVPPSISWQEVHDSIKKLPGVTGVHDLHIWSISQGITALSVHAHTIDSTVDVGEVIREIAKIGLKNGITHSTAQVQPFSLSEDGKECIACLFTHTAQDCVTGRNDGHV